MTAPWTLLTFAPMIDSEFSRFALAHYGVEFEEERHLFGWVSLLALGRAGTLQIPLLKGVASLPGPEQMVEYFEKTCPPERRLIPSDGMLATQVAADMARFHGTLGDATAVLGYYHLLPERALMLDPFSRGIPPGEARALGAIYPVFAGLFKLLLNLTPAHAASALDQTRLLFDEAGRRLVGGGPYLVGGRFTLSDIALATAAGPLLLPVHYGSPMPQLDAMPQALRAVVAELRAHPVGRAVAEVYRRHRLGD